MPHLDDVKGGREHSRVIDSVSQVWVQELCHWHEVIPPQAGVVTAFTIGSKPPVAVAEPVLAPSQLIEHRHPEQQPASALVGPCSVCVLALQTASASDKSHCLLQVGLEVFVAKLNASAMT
jgi:hypothetical protein